MAKPILELNFKDGLFLSKTKRSYTTLRFLGVSGVSRNLVRA